MKKLQCPKCRGKWYEDDIIKVRTQAGSSRAWISQICIKDFIFCPKCFFEPKSKEHPDMYVACCERVVLQKSDVKKQYVVARDEFGNYLDIPIDQIKIREIGEPAGPTLTSEWGHSDDNDYESSGVCDY